MLSAILKYTTPRGLYGRAALILIVPIVTIQLVVSVIFLQRHFEDVTRQMTATVIRDLQLVFVDPAAMQSLEIKREDVPVADQDVRLFYDLSGIVVTQELRRAFEDLRVVDLRTDHHEVRLVFDTLDEPLVLSRRRVSASNPHQLLVLMVFTSLVMTAVAYIFLRNQVRPIRRLARAAEAFGRGESVGYAPTGATEVRAAGAAFLDMRARLERHIEQRTLLLSGVSHDLRTPLTRMRLALSLMEGAEAGELLEDVEEMQRMIDAFLSFARENAGEAPQLVDPAAILRKLAEDYTQMGYRVSCQVPDTATETMLRPVGFSRAVENLIKNAVNYGTQAKVTLEETRKTLTVTVEDDGPGIPRDAREMVTRPFTRLDEARGSQGGSVGLGLAIVTDVVRSHGGQLRLEESAELGGLKAVIVIPQGRGARKVNAQNEGLAT